MLPDSVTNVIRLRSDNSWACTFAYKNEDGKWTVFDSVKEDMQKFLDNFDNSKLSVQKLTRAME